MSEDPREPRDEPGGRRDDDRRDEDEAPMTEADIERLLSALGPTAPEPERPGEPGPATGDAADPAAADVAGATGDVDPAADPGTPARIALVLTPVASAPALAGLCAMAGLDVTVVPSRAGAVAALEVPARAPADDWDVGELLGEGGGPFPPEAEELAATLSRLARAGVVLLGADLATDVGIESGLSGHLSARRYAGGAAEGDVPAGLVLAGADQVVEDLILGRVRPGDVPGSQTSADLPRWRAARLFGRGLRRRQP